MLRSGNGLRSLYIHCARKMSYRLDKVTIMWILAGTLIKTNHPQLDQVLSNSNYRGLDEESSNTSSSMDWHR